MLAFNRQVFTYDKEAIVQAKMAHRLASFIPEGTHFLKGYEFGCGTGMLTEQLLQRSIVDNLLLNDLSPQMLTLAKQKLEPSQGKAFHQIRYVAGPCEQLSLPPGSFDLIASSATLQWISSPFDFLRKTISLLRPEGILLLATFGEKNLWQLRDLTKRGLHYPTLKEYISFFSAENLTLIHAEEEQVTLFFPNTKSLFRHLQNTGVNNLSQVLPHHPPLTKGDLKSLSDHYEKIFATPQGLPLTYHPLYLVARHTIQ